MATILVVDDRPANRPLLVSLLCCKGHRMLEAEGGGEALALVRSARPDLVICDIVMPTMDGYQFVRELRGELRIAATNVIFCTAHFSRANAPRLSPGSSRSSRCRRRERKSW
jgi:two-component system, cell cycle sensor histidine kinase and response regulator CckA